jgi:hypothetical protein
MKSSNNALLGQSPTRTKKKESSPVKRQFITLME